MQITFFVDKSQENFNTLTNRYN